MKLNTKSFRHLSAEDWRVLTAVELGSRNHELVPITQIISLAALKTGANGTHKAISTLARAGLVARAKHASYDGYRLTYGGLDYLALHAHTKSGKVLGLGSQMGVGKESDIYLVTVPETSSVEPHAADDIETHEDGEPQRHTSRSAESQQPEQTIRATQAVLKLHRLGRISFRSANTNRTYTQRSRRTHASWQHLSTLSARREWGAMRALHTAGLRVPRPLAWNRHALVMGLVPGVPLKDVPLSAFEDPQAPPQDLSDAAENLTLDEEQDLNGPRRRRGAHPATQERIAALYTDIMNLTLELAGYGLIHGDLNEFNILIENVPDTFDTANPAQHAGISHTSLPPKVMCPHLIDFPQVTSMSHPQAAEYFERDINGVKEFFRKRYHFEPAAGEAGGPSFGDALEALSAGKAEGRPRLDVEVLAAGYSKKMAKGHEAELNEYYKQSRSEAGAEGLDYKPSDQIYSNDSSHSEVDDEDISEDIQLPLAKSTGDVMEEDKSHVLEYKLYETNMKAPQISVNSKSPRPATQWSI